MLQFGYIYFEALSLISFRTALLLVSLILYANVFFMEVSMANEKIPLMYKGHPLRRKDNLIYYGDMADSHIILLQIMDSKPVGDLNVATKVSIQLQLTSPDLKGRDRVVKRSEKDSLYAAIDIASVWLERALAAR